jgi:hypothetical protein
MTTATGSVSLTSFEADRQSLTTGSIGPALAAVEQARAGVGDWAIAHRLVKRVASGPVDAAAHAGLYYGAPAVLFLLHAAGGDDGRGPYAQATQTLARHVGRLTRQRLTTAQERIRRNQPAAFAEYDLFYGLTGIGVLLLLHLPGCDELGDLLAYIVRLTEPRTDNGQQVPGWWVGHDPDSTLPTPGGHANFGMAHGAAGLLALLALSVRRGRQVDGQADAIERLCDWFDYWRQETPHGTWWPQWLCRDQLRTGRSYQDRPGRPSWCYGAAGIARALQLAAIVTNNPVRQAAAESVLAACLGGDQLERLTEPGMCHGLAGLHRTAARAAADARTPDIARKLPDLTQRLTRCQPAPGNGGFLTGQAGLSLASDPARTGTPPRTGWDACLLIT